MKKLLFVGVLALVVAGFIGCGGKSLKTESVEGIVKYKGTPVAEATVVFSPKDPSGVAATAMTDAEGKYKLTAGQGGVQGKGTVAGEYNVGITKTKNVAKQPTPEEVQKASEKGEDITKKYPPKYEHEVPQKYNSPAKSGLTATVKAGKNTIDFDLTE